MAENPPVPLEELLARQREVRRLVRGLARDEDEADELEQEGWLRALERPPRDAQNLLGRFGSVVRRLRVDRARRSANRLAREAEHDERGPLPPTDELVARLELDQHVVRAVLALDPPYREVVLLRFWEGASLPEIAERTGRPLETVRTRLRRALVQLREKLDRKYGERAAWAGLAGVPKVAAGAAVGVLGGIVMKKVVLAAAAVALVFVVQREWLGGPSKPRGIEGAEVVGELVEATVASVEVEPEPVQAVEGSTREALVANVEPATTTAIERRVFGRVLDPDGAPIAGATVFVNEMQWRGARGSSDWQRYRELVSAVDGSFECPLDLPKNARVTAIVRHGDWWTWGNAGERAAGAGDLDLGTVTLRPAGCVEGRVVDERGTPIEAAKVDVFADGVDGVHTDEEGRFAHCWVAAGANDVVVRHSDHRATRLEGIVVEHGGTTRIGDVVLQDPFVLAGTVVDLLGVPIEGLRLFACPSGSGRTSYTDSDAEGRFRFALPQGGPHGIVLSDGTRMAVREEVETYLPGTTDVRLTVPRAVEVEVQVVDAESGSPLERFGLEVGSLGVRREDPDESLLRSSHVFALNDFRLQENDLESLERHVDGSVRRRLVPEIDVVAVHRPGYQTAYRLVPPGAARLVVELRPLASLEGRVVLDGEPVPGSYVKPRPLGPSGGSVVVRTVQADHQGRFLAEELEEGTYELEAWAPGGFLRRKVDVRGSLDLGDVSLGPACRITGQVLVPEDREPDEVWISLQGASRWAQPEPDGRFVIEGVPPGEYVLSARERNVGDWFGSHEETVALRVGVPSDVTIDLRDRGYAELAVDVTLAYEVPMDAAAISLMAVTSRGRVRVGHVTGNGRFETSRVDAPCELTGFELEEGAVPIATFPVVPTRVEAGARVQRSLFVDAMLVSLPLGLEEPDPLVQVRFEGDAGTRFETEGARRLRELVGRFGFAVTVDPQGLRLPPVRREPGRVTVTLRSSEDAEPVEHAFRVTLDGDEVRVERED